MMDSIQLASWDEIFKPYRKWSALEKIRSQKLNDGLVKKYKSTLRALCKQDNFFLATEVLGYKDMNLEFHKPLCKTVQKAGPEEWQLHLHARGHFKSTVVTITNPIRLVLNDPDLRILIANAVEAKAQSFVTEIKSHFVNNILLKELFPECAITKKSDAGNLSSFIVPARQKHWLREGTFNAIGIKSAIVSSHYDIVVFDDIVGPENVTTAEFREKVRAKYREYLSLIDPPGYVIMVGTRWDDSDLYGAIIEETLSSGIEQFINDDGTIEEDSPIYKIYKTSVYQEGTAIPVFPQRFDAKRVRLLKKQQGPYIFSCQYLNDPVPKESAKFDSSKINIVPILVKPKDSQVHRVLSIDPAIDKREKKDPACLTIADITCEGNIYIQRIINQQMNPDEFIETIIALLKKWDPHITVMEGVAFQRIYRFYLEKRMREIGIWYPIEEAKRSSREAKEDRILRVQPYINEGKFYYITEKEDDKELKQLLSQLDRFPYATHDDILDTLADVIEVMRVPSYPRERKEVVEYVSKSRGRARSGRCSYLRKIE